jgi:hypothetical protein
VYLSFVDKLFNASDLNNKDTQTFLSHFTGFEAWVKLHKKDNHPKTMPAHIAQS